MTAYLFSCENATCAVPEAYRDVFRGSEEVVMSPEGWEPGALALAQSFAMKFRSPLVHTEMTRLLVDFEKDGEERWSRFSIKLPEATRAKIVDRHSNKYYQALKDRIEEDLKRHSRALHLRIHTDPGGDGQVVLMTPPGATLAEKFATAWRIRLTGHEIDARHVAASVQDALAEGLGAAFPPDRYAQIRLVVSQGFFLQNQPLRWENLKKLLLESLAATVAGLNGLESPSTAPS